MRTGNLGEWSEMYAFLKVLLDGDVPEGDSNLKPRGPKVHFLDILRDDSSGLNVFRTKLPKYEHEGEIVTRLEVEQVLQTFLSGEWSSGKNGAFAVPEFSDIMAKLGILKLKASSTEKIDLLAHVASEQSDEALSLGFSIKSELGSPATLINAGSHTAFRYRIDCDLETALEISDGYSRSEVRKLIDFFFRSGVNLISCGPKSPSLRSNVEFFGHEVPDLMASLLLGYYSGKGKSLTKLLPEMDFHDTALKQVQYKVGQVLRAAALGMKPATPWAGFHEAHGGFLVVKRDGSLVVLSARNEDDFRSYLLQRAFFDTPSTSRHKFGFVYEHEGAPHLDLSLQVRFASSPLK